MPKLHDSRQVKTITLPSFEGSQVEVYTQLTIGEQRAVADIPGTPFTKQLEAIRQCIKSWNFTEDDEGKNPTPITIENLGLLMDQDFILILETVSGKTFDELQKMGGLQIGQTATEKKRNT